MKSLRYPTIYNIKYLHRGFRHIKCFGCGVICGKHDPDFFNGGYSQWKYCYQCLVRRDSAGLLNEFDFTEGCLDCGCRIFHFPGDGLVFELTPDIEYCSSCGIARGYKDSPCGGERPSLYAGGYDKGKELEAYEDAREFYPEVLRGESFKPLDEGEDYEEVG